MLCEDAVMNLMMALLLLASQEDGFTPLFDGKSLEGWVSQGGGTWSVEDGTILGETGDGTYGWLCTKKSYGDFILEFEAKHEANGNSGIQVRSRIDEKGVMIGYQFDLDRTRPSSGRLYDEARRLLRIGGFSIKEVALRSGFGDQYYFSRVFRKVVHMSPSAFVMAKEKD